MSESLPADGRPRIRAFLQGDGTGTITLDGTTSFVNEADTAAARNAVIGVAVQSARQQGGPVRVTSTDPDGQWLLLVGPDGSVQHESPEPAAPVVGATDAGHADLADEAIGTDETDDADGVDDWPDPGALVDPVRRESRAADTPDEPAPEPEHVPARAWPAEPEPARQADPAPAAAPAQPGPSAPWDQPPAPWSQPPAAPARSWPPQGPSGAPTAAPQPAAASAPVAPLPTLNDLLDSRPAPAPGPAEWGWQAAIRRLTFGAIKPRPGPAEMQHRTDVAAVQRSLAGPRTIVVVNPKGGAHKTTATMLIAATFGMHRGGYTLAWDNNETRGTLGWRAVPARHTNTAVNLLADLERFDDPARARIGDLDNYVRSQGSSQFDVLASDEDARASASIDANAFRRLHAALSRFYRIMIIDTGNNMRASNWGAALEAADQLVIVSTVREDTAASAAWLVDGLRSRLFEDKVANAVMLLSAPGLQPDPALRARLSSHFGRLTRAVIDVPYDPALVDGAAIDVERLQPATREAWLHATAVIAEGL